MKDLFFILVLVCFFCSCGVTKATVAKPAAGTTTTITITTNNPITTDVSPDVKLSGRAAN